MSGDVETDSPRPRPLSGGLWTLFSWLRRDEHSSSDSLSSAGSDRTAASFAFLGPGHYSTASPAVLPPPPPPTDSYKKRVHDRNVRRQHERDITFHRKYGLYGFGYDAFSLPSARRSAAGLQGGDRSERDRRAASESLRAHVPGKRRAPLPPTPLTASLTRRRARKRPAPLPPPDLVKENVTIVAVPSVTDIEPMNRPQASRRDERLPQNNEMATGCKNEKYSKKDAPTKDVKIRHEKSFLKQIFENRKRNSAIETASVKLLPNISELDKQAAEMIEKYRLKELTRTDIGTEKELESNDISGSSKQQMEAWICTRCLRKYNSSVITCNYCLPLNKVCDSYRASKPTDSCSQTKINPSLPGTSSGIIEDKAKLKEMLKEMKDSLPKRPKSDISAADKPIRTTGAETKVEYPRIVEAPTLRIGSTSKSERNDINQPSVSSSLNTEPSISQFTTADNSKANEKKLTTIDSVIITQPVILVHTKENIVVNKNKESAQTSLFKNNTGATSVDIPNKKKTEIERIQQTNDPKPLNMICKTKCDLNTPLKISSLLNPIYVPKITSSTNTQTPSILKQISHKEDNTKKCVTNTEIPAHKGLNVDVLPFTQNKPSIPDLDKPCISEPEQDKKEKNMEVIKEESIKTESEVSEAKINAVGTGALQGTGGPSTSTSVGTRIDQHARRRDLINQLEQSIAKGDERAAAEAAVKLAQLRLSCSVLSFSSQIVADTLNSSPTTVEQSKVFTPDAATFVKTEDATQKSSQLLIEPTKPLTKPSTEITSGLNLNKNNEMLTPKVTETEKVNIKKADNLILPKMEVKPKIESNSGVNKVVTSQNPGQCAASTSKSVSNTEDVPILVWVEDKESTRGPVQLHVRRGAVMGDLRGQAEKSLGLAVRMQRWIVGRTLCSDDNTPLVALAGPELSAPFYLCLVESDTAKANVEVKINEDPGNVYNELVKLEKQPLVSNAEGFECGVCMEECAPGEGVVLRECVHTFCKQCLSDVVRHSEEPVVSCPAMGCRGVLQEREVRGIVSSEEYEKWLARGLAAAESGTRNSFHCRTRDCTGWALCDPGVRKFPCPVCKCTNCVPCQAIHEGETCEQYRVKIQESVASPDDSQTDEGTRALLDTLISRGEALECPECSAIITKKWGCDWVKCSACKTEICWVTKGRRWGPAGRGDTSAGCRCGVDGKRCHPSCGYCH